MCRRTGIRNTGLFEPFRCESCRSYCHVEYLGNGSAYGSFVFCRIAEDHIVGGDASLAVGRVGQIVQPRFACQRMRKFDGIARCVNIRCRSLQVIIYPNAARFADLQSGGLGQCRFRTNPDRQKNHVGGNAFSGREENPDLFALALESFDAAFEIEFDTFLRQVLVYMGRD